MSAPATTRTAPVRSNFGFSPSGHLATCVRTADSESVLEVWSWQRGSATRRSGSELVDSAAQALPLDDGSVLLLGNDAEIRDLVLLDPHGGKRLLARVHGIGGYLLAAASGALGFLIVREGLDRTVVSRIGQDSVTPVLSLPGATTGGVWLGDDTLALTLAAHGSATCAVAVDVRARRWRTLFSVSEASNDRVLAYGPQSRLMLVETNATGEERIGWVRLDGSNAVRFPEVLHQPGARSTVVAMNEATERVLVRRESGSVSVLGVFSPERDHLDRVELPPGVVQGHACWRGGTIRIPFSSPTRPPTVLSLGTTAELLEPPGETTQWAAADRTEFELESGPVEAIVYGDWRTCDRVVLALHGGPLSAWRFEFEPLFQDLVDDGCAVVAPNYRGSVGYGAEHQCAIIGAWGGPDLDDVFCLAHRIAAIRSARTPPILLGASYGAYLALLAAGIGPGLWSACVAIAPLLSGPRLHACSTPTLARRLEQLGALDEIADSLGPRDVLRHCAALAAPLLLLHSVDDEVIPVGQSRMLHQRLRQLDRACTYREITGGHQAVVTARSRAVRETVTEFCRPPFGR